MVIVPRNAGQTLLDRLLEAVQQGAFTQFHGDDQVAVALPGTELAQQIDVIGEQHQRSRDGPADLRNDRNGEH